MTVYKSTQVAQGGIPINERGASFFVVGVFALTAAFASGDSLQLCQVPNGYKVLNVTLDTPALDSNASPTLTGTVGDASANGRYITLTTANLHAGGVFQNNVAGGIGYVYAPATSGGNAGGTIISLYITANPATGVSTGTITCAIELQIDNPSFA